MSVVLVELLDLRSGDVPKVVEGGFGVRDSLLGLLLPLLHLLRLVLVSLSCFRPGRRLVLMADFYSKKKKNFLYQVEWRTFSNSDLSSSPHCSIK